MNFNNNMKQVLHILLTLLLLFTFSCNDDNVNNDNNSILIGSWGEQFPADEFFELTFYNDDTGVMTVYYNEGKKKSPDPFTYSFDKNTMRLVIVFSSIYRVRGSPYFFIRALSPSSSPLRYWRYKLSSQVITFTSFLRLLQM